MRSLCVCLVKWHDMHGAVFHQAGRGHLGMAGIRRPFSSMKWPPALSNQRWWTDMRACLAVVGVSFPSWLSAFFSGENSSSRSTSYTTNVLLDTQRSASAHRYDKLSDPKQKISQKQIWNSVYHQLLSINAKHSPLPASQTCGFGAFLCFVSLYIKCLWDLMLDGQNSESSLLK